MSLNELLNKVQSLAVWDDKGMFDRMLGDEELAKMIIEQFLLDSKPQINSLETSILDGDLDSVKQQAHAVKGASANVGGERFRNVAYAIEVAAGNLDLEEVKRRLPLLKQTYTELAGTLEEYLEKLNNIS